MPQKPTRLKFETERLKAGPLIHDVSESPELFDLLDDPEFLFEEPVMATLTLRLVGDSVYMTGTIQTIAKAPCARCLDALRVPLRAEVAMTYMQDPRLLEPDKYPELVDDNTRWYDGEAIFPADDLREILLLELPTVPACELDREEVCPISGRKFGPWVFGAVTEEQQEPEGDLSLGSQLRRMRKDLKG